MPDPTGPSTPGTSDPARLFELAARAEAPAASFEPPPLQQIAASLPDYEIEELIGRGGMGAVYRARQKRLERQVAIKVLPPEIARDPASAERFQREARTLARLSHPNIVKIFDFGTAQDLSYLVLEYIEGVNLRQLMSMGRLSPEEALRLVPRICEALQYAHDQGVVHRDVKPENILVDQAGDVHIADFGLARLLDPEERTLTLTSQRQRLGTPHYMAPEQVETPERVDHRADIFAVGVVLYEMLTGSLPLGRFGPPSREAPVGPRVDDIVMRSLERDPSRRYQAARSMQKDVEAAEREGIAMGRRSSRRGDREQPRRGADASGPSAKPLRLSRLALGGLVWFLASVVVSLVEWLVAINSQEPGVAPPAPQPSGNIVWMVLKGLIALGFVGGAVMGYVARNRIEAAKGQLGGRLIATLAMCGPAFWVLDWLILYVAQVTAMGMAAPAVALLALALLYLNYWFIARRTQPTWQKRRGR